MAATKVTFADKAANGTVTSSDINSLKAGTNGAIDDAAAALTAAASKVTQSQVDTSIGAAISQILGGAPDQYNTLGELSTALIILQNAVTGNTPDGDSLVNTIQEVLAIFASYPEGATLAQALNGKVDTTNIYNGTDLQVAGKVLDGRVGYTLQQAINAVTTSLGNYVTTTTLIAYQTSVTSALANKVDKSGTKVLSTNDYTDADKYTVSSIYKLGNAVASAATVDLTNIAGDYAHITGSVAITAFSTLPAGQEKTFIFDGTPILSNSANLILPNGVSLQVSAGDTGTFRSEGGGVWRLLYFQAAGSYVDFNPNWTGFSAAPAAPGAAKYKFLSPNSIHVLICFDGTPGVSNATTTTFQLPYNATSSMFIIAPCSILSGAAYSTGTLRTRKGSNIVDIFAGGINTAWAASGNKNIFINNIFMIE